jgi:hypothetical protein
MTDERINDIQNRITEALNEAKVQGQITQEQIFTREHAIAKLTTLLAVAFKKGTNGKGRGGLKTQQKWFSIAASLAQSLARLTSDLEYDNLRSDLEQLKKRVLQGNVASQRNTLHQARPGATGQTSGEQRT